MSGLGWKSRNYARGALAAIDSRPMNRLARAVNIEDLRLMARRRLPRSVFDFFDGGAETESTLRGNRAAFERVRLLPKVLVDVSQVDTGIEIFGARSSLPMAIAPTGGVGAGRNGADVMLARAARAAGIPYTLATCCATASSA
jgi:(S)-mandelate dehydrogenase